MEFIQWAIETGGFIGGAVCGAAGTVYFEVRANGEGSDIIDTAGSYGHLSINEEIG